MRNLYLTKYGTGTLLYHVALGCFCYLFCRFWPLLSSLPSPFEGPRLCCVLFYVLEISYWPRRTWWYRPKTNCESRDSIFRVNSKFFTFSVLYSENIHHIVDICRSAIAQE